MSKVITASNFQTEVLNSDKAVLVDFHATWCGPCQLVGPILNELEASRGDFILGKVDVDEEPGLAQEYKITAVPTMILFKNGQQVNRIVGMASKADLEKMISQV